MGQAGRLVEGRYRMWALCKTNSQQNMSEAEVDCSYIEKFVVLFVFHLIKTCGPDLINLLQKLLASTLTPVRVTSCCVHTCIFPLFLLWRTLIGLLGKMDLPDYRHWIRQVQLHKLNSTHEQTHNAVGFSGICSSGLGCMNWTIIHAIVHPPLNVVPVSHFWADFHVF